MTSVTVNWVLVKPARLVTTTLELTLPRLVPSAPYTSKFWGAVGSRPPGLPPPKVNSGADPVSGWTRRNPPRRWHR